MHEVQSEFNQVNTSTGGWTCYRCGQFIPWNVGDHVCPQADLQAPQLQPPPSFTFGYDPQQALIAQKLDRVIELLEKILLEIELQD